MKLLEALGFGAAAIALHVAAFGWAVGDDVQGAAGGGDDGAADATILAAPGQIAALVAAWEKPPEAAQSVAAPARPARPGTEPEFPGSAAMAMPRRPGDPVPIPAPRGGADRTDRAPVSPAPPRQAPPAPATPDAPVPAAMPPAPVDAAPSLPRTNAAPGARGAAPGPMAPPEDARDTVPAPQPAPTVPQPAEPEVAATHAPETSQRPASRPDNLAPPPRPAAAQPKPSQPQRAAQRARGQKADAPPAPRAQPREKAKPQAGPSAGQVQAAKAQWGAQIRSAVARAQRYPGNSRATGRATIRLDVAPSGRLRAVALVGSSGHPALDRAALAAARQARLPRAPGVLRDAAYSFNLPLSFARR